MTDYDPLIPAANNILSQSQVDIQNNFLELNTIFDVDHLTWNSDPSGNRGFHRQITMPDPLAVAPTPIVDQGILYPFADTNDTSARTQLYFKNQSNTIQITNRFKSASTDGYLMIPGNISSPAIIIMWGFVSSPGSGNHDVDFPIIGNYAYTGGQTQGFPNNCFNIMLTTNASSAQDTATLNRNSAFTKKKFFYRMSASSTDLYWFAIGN